ncbi:MAG: class I SAM-dependent methyltransferase [Opitutaceae bacterium]|nr:class I SAM-dependent methyltransferase [Opitutaceae bacterium]
MLRILKDLLRPAWHKVRETLRRRRRWPSETSKCRARLAPYCTGYGLDIGFGGDPINAAAIRVDLVQPYGTVGRHPVQLGGDAGNLPWFRDNTLDYVFSSHLLEDFQDTEAVLREWLRVLKPGGRLIIYCPDEMRYRAHCRATGQPYNIYHVHADFSLEFVQRALARIGGTRTIHANPSAEIYSWDLVAEKLTLKP